MFQNTMAMVLRIRLSSFKTKTKFLERNNELAGEDNKGQVEAFFYAKIIL